MARGKAEDVVCKEDVMEDLIQQIAEKGRRSDTTGDITLTQIGTRMTAIVNEIQAQDDKATTELQRLTRPQLNRLHGLMDSTNGDQKTDNFKAMIFKNELTQLKAKKKTCVEIESALFDIVALMLTKEFGDGEGKILWRTTMKDKISEIISEIDTTKGKGKGYAKGVAEASANQNDADMTDGH